MADATKTRRMATDASGKVSADERKSPAPGLVRTRTGGSRRPSRPRGRSRILLAVSGDGTSSLLTSSDGVRFSAPVASWAGSQPAPVRRGSILYVYDQPTLNADGLSGTVHRFAVGAGGSLAEKAAVPYTVQLGSPEDAARATAGSFAPSFAVDENGALVLLYSLRFEPATNACPAAGQVLRQAPHRDRGARAATARPSRATPATAS